MTDDDIDITSLFGCLQTWVGADGHQHVCTEHIDHAHVCGCGAQTPRMNGHKHEHKPAITTTTTVLTELSPTLRTTAHIEIGTPARVKAGWGRLAREDEKPS